jgi:hypothetical protein
MPDAAKVKKTSLKTPGDQVVGTSVTLPKTKEQEPKSSEKSAFAEEEKLMTEIRTVAETADRQALEALQSTLTDAKRAHFEADLPPDVSDAGVVSPAKSAEEVVTRGATIELGTSEQVYKTGLHRKIAGHVVNKVVVGASSLAALALWISRLLKMAHKHTMKVIFKKGATRN